MKSISANLAQSINFYTIVSVILGASGAILGIFGGNHLVGALLAGLGVLSVPLQGLFASWVILIPAAAYADILKVYAALVGLTGAAAIINQWVLSYAPSLRADVTVVLTAAALIASLIAQAFHVSASKAASNVVVKHG